MKNTFNIFLASLAVLFLCHQLQAANISLVSPRQKEGVSAVVVKDIKNYTENHPNTQLKKFTTKVLHYLGKREKGDSNLFVFGGDYYYPLINEASSETTYPVANTSQVITYVEIYFEGDADGKVYVADGGIGQRYISLVVVAPKTEGYFSYRTHVYGKN